jgi:hypothetical protein
MIGCPPPHLVAEHETNIQLTSNYRVREGKHRREMQRTCRTCSRMFERAYMPAYDLGAKKNQFTFAIDAIIRY